MNAGPLLYVYAVARHRPGRAGTWPVVEGVVGGRAAECWRADAFLLVASAVPEGLPVTDLSGARSDTPSDPGGGRAVERLAVTHFEVLLAFLADYTLLPLRLGSLYADPGELERRLVQARVAVTAALDRLEGGREWSVSLRCDEAALALDGERQALEREAAMATPGKAFFLQRRLRRTTADVSRRATLAAAGEVHAALAPLAREATAMAPPGPGGGMAKAAYLVAEECEAAFLARVAALSEVQARRGVSCHIGGPWPAFSFARVPGLGPGLESGSEAAR